MTDCPVGIAIIPWICNILPIIWLTDSELIVPELDEDFYNCIEEFKRGYIDMYPMLEFKGKIIAESIKQNRPVASGGSACFFSGGVDAFNTLFQHLDEHPSLITIWGADVKLDDTLGWDIVYSHTLSTASKLNLDSYVIKSNFHSILNEKTLFKRLISNSGDGWWHGFQHGIGLIGLAAPLCFSLGIHTLYIASSFTAADKGKYTCASDPTIDNFVRFSNCRICHDGYEFTRMMKIKNICEHSDRIKDFNPVLRVCWMETGGKNCCHCEKCLRTMAALFVQGRDPKDFGFDYSDSDLKKSKNLKKSLFGII